MAPPVQQSPSQEISVLLVKLGLVREYARSAEIMGKPIIQVPVWMRVPGGTGFSISALLVAWFVLRVEIAAVRGVVPVASPPGGAPTFDHVFGQANGDELAWVGRPRRATLLTFSEALQLKQFTVGFLASRVGLRALANRRKAMHCATR
jgi:hypothetical protein